jgi:hypothetical protein
MNAAERLWRALARRDWEAARAQFHPTAVIELIGGADAEGRLDVAEYVADHREHAARGQTVEVVRTLSAAGNVVAVEARADGARCACFYDLHEGRIARATEYWVPPTPPTGAQGRS